MSKTGSIFNRPLGLLACVLTLVSQLALGAVALPDADPRAELAALDAAMLDCAPGPGGMPPLPVRRDHGEAALCPLTVIVAQPGIVISPAPLLPLPGAMMVVRAERLPPARAPPPVLIAASYPRGPPSLA